MLPVQTAKRRGKRLWKLFWNTLSMRFVMYFRDNLTDGIWGVLWNTLSILFFIHRYDPGNEHLWNTMSLSPFHTSQVINEYPLTWDCFEFWRFHTGLMMIPWRLANGPSMSAINCRSNPSNRRYLSDHSPQVQTSRQTNRSWRSDGHACCAIKSHHTKNVMNKNWTKFVPSNGAYSRGGPATRPGANPLPLGSGWWR